VKLVTSIRSLSSRWVAWAFAAAYLAVSAVVGTVLLTMPKTDVTDAGTQTTYISEDQPEIMVSPAPAGFQWVRGPAGMQTVIPYGWQSVAAGQPGAMRAVDPADPGRIVGFGGARALSDDIVRTHIGYEESFAGRTKAYHRVDLNSATYGGHKAVEWQFTHQDGGGPQRVQALYWLVDGVEYFLFVSGPDQQWSSRMKPVYDAMVANSSP
jgi:hypothetical protein